jgi:hypothetical protein
VDEVIDQIAPAENDGHADQKRNKKYWHFFLH